MYRTFLHNHRTHIYTQSDSQAKQQSRMKRRKQRQHHLARRHCWALQAGSQWTLHGCSCTHHSSGDNIVTTTSVAADSCWNVNQQHRVHMSAVMAYVRNMCAHAASVKHMTMHAIPSWHPVVDPLTLRLQLACSRAAAAISAAGSGSGS